MNVQRKSEIWRVTFERGAYPAWIATYQNRSEPKDPWNGATIFPHQEWIKKGGKNISSSEPTHWCNLSFRYKDKGGDDWYYIIAFPIQTEDLPQLAQELEEREKNLRTLEARLLPLLEEFDSAEGVLEREQQVSLKQMRIAHHEQELAAEWKKLLEFHQQLACAAEEISSARDTIVDVLERAKSNEPKVLRYTYPKSKEL